MTTNTSTNKRGRPRLKTLEELQAMRKKDERRTVPPVNFSELKAWYKRNKVDSLIE